MTTPVPFFRKCVLILLLLAVAAIEARPQSSAESREITRPTRIRKINLGPDINSIYSELAPIISPDGKLLFFTMGTGNPNNLGEDHLQDCYVSRKMGDGRWSTPRNLGAPINSTGNDAISGVSPDGSVLFIKNFGYNRRNGLCFARYKGRGEWKIDSITIQGYENKGSLATQCISADGKTIIFSAERDGNGADLYASHLINKEKNIFGVPVNLGPAINTSSDEFAPFLAPDGKTLYFSSKGHQGFGDADVFVAKRLDDSWTKWSTPKNLGGELNTSGMDAYYSIPASGDVAYFSSSNGANHMDIYMVTLTDEVRSHPMLIVTGKVLNEKGRPLDATVTYRRLMTDSLATSATTNPTTGQFALILPFGERYAMTAEARGYLPYSDNIDLTNRRVFQELSTVVTLDTETAGSTVVLRNIFFDLDRASLTPESHFELDRLAELLRTNSKWRVTIEGFTDSVGSEPHNIKLSKDRAEAVVDYLRGKEIEPDRLSASGFGSSNPVATNATEEGRSQNRRVVFRLENLHDD